MFDCPKGNLLCRDKIPVRSRLMRYESTLSRGGAREQQMDALGKP